MNSIETSDIDTVMIKAASALRSLQRENQSLRDELLKRDRQEHATKIASSAVERGMMDVNEASDYAQTLVESNKDLDIVEDFVSKTVTGIPLGSGLAKTASDHSIMGGSTDVLTAYLLSNEIP